MNLTYDNCAQTRSLYIHWPFCPYKCHFCPFVALASHDQYMGRYHAALVQEIEQFVLNQPEKRCLDTIFLGGGTPSTYPDDLLLDTFGKLSKWFSFSPNAEVTIEVNPGTVRKEQLVLWKEIGITRLSIGVQSLDDQVLKKLNRLQSAVDVHSLLNDASPLFDHISIDLILGLPEVTPDAWKVLVEKVIRWPINHISIYFLSIHEDTPLYFGVKAKKIIVPGDDEMVDLYCWTIEKLAEAGLEQYEVSNFSRVGYQSQHNSVYWQRKPYKGFGLGACSFDGKHRFQNQKNLLAYLTGVEKNNDILIFRESLTKQQIKLESMMLGLRRTQGIAIADLFEECSILECKKLNEVIGWLREHNFVKEKNGYLMLTPAGLAVENEIVTRLSL